MRVQFIFSEIWVALRRNLSMSISVALVTMVSVLFLGLGLLAQRQLDTMTVQLSDPTKYDVVTSALIGAPGIGNVQDQRTILDPLFNVLKGLSFGALGLAALMVLCFVLLVATTIRQTAFSRRRETGIMRLVGASAFNIQLPFILETLIATVTGSALAVIALWALVRYGIGYLGSQLPISFITTSDLWTVTPWLVGTAAGMAMLTAWLTLRRYLQV